MPRIPTLAVGACVLALTAGLAVAQIPNPCAAEPGVALEVEIQSGHLYRPHGYGIGPDWVMAVHPRMPQSPFLVPPGWKVLMEGPGVYATLISLVSQDGRAEVDFLFAGFLPQRLGATADALATQTLYGGGGELQPICNWSTVQPGPIDVSIMAATAEGMTRMAMAEVAPGVNTYMLQTVSAPREYFAAIVQGVLVPILDQFSDASGKSSPEGEECPESGPPQSRMRPGGLGW